MRYLLLVKTPTADDELTANEGWRVAGVTPYDEITVEWQEISEERLRDGQIEDFHIVTIERGETPYRVKGGVTHL